MVFIKKIIPFEKELLFKTKVCEITSISLEHKINQIEDDLISGIFHINGDYKITEGSINRQNFSFDVDFDIALDSRYDTTNMIIDIDNFTYKIVNDEILKVNIDLFIDGDLKKDEAIQTITDTEEKEEQKEVLNRQKTIENETQVKDIEQDNKDTQENYNIFDTIDESETYATYHVYIVKEEDTIEKIIEKYNVSKEILALYNNIEDIKALDKIIIPTTNNG